MSKIAYVKVINKAGLHARAATKLVQLANRYRSEVFIEKSGQEVNAKSIMGVLLLVASVGSEIRVRCEGIDEEACLLAILALIHNKFGEDE